MCSSQSLNSPAQFLQLRKAREREVEGLPDRFFYVDAVPLLLFDLYTLHRMGIAA